MSEKVKAIRGSKERAEEVKQWLIEHGAKEFFESKCNAEDFLYCVTPDGFVVQFAVKTSSYLFDVEELPRWRAAKEGTYFYINALMEITVESDNRVTYDNKLYACGNYFKTESEARKMSNKIIELLKNNKL